MGHYPFGIFKIGPKIRSGRRFEKKILDLINHRPKPLKNTVHKTCSENLIQYLGRSMGPYPFGNLGIQPKMRSGQRFENQNQCLQPCTAPNCKNQFSGGVNCQKGL